MILKKRGNIFVYASSPSVVDFTSLAFVSLINKFKNNKLYALIKSDVKISKSGKNRKFESRFSLPLAQLGLSPDGTHRQRFIPIENLSLKKLIKSIELMGETYSELVYLGGNRDLAEKVKINTRSLSNSVKNVYNIKEPLKTRGTLAVLRSIYSNLKLSNIIVESYEKLFPLFIKKDNFSKYLLVLVDQAKLLNVKKGLFHKGGIIEVYDNDNKKLDEIKSFELLNTTLFLFGNKLKFECDHKKNVLSIIEGENTHINKNFKFNFKGPIDILRLLQYGILGHVPWYYDIIEDINGSLELISPLTVISSKRSGFNNHQPFKLNPTGFTLFDYDDKVIKAFINGIFNKPWSNYNIDINLKNYQKLIDTYPSQRELGSKSRSGLRKYFQHIKKYLNNNRPNCALESIRLISKSQKIKNISSIFDLLIAYYDIFDYIADSCMPESTIFMDEKFILELKKLKILDNQLLNSFSLANNFCKIIKMYVEFFNDNGFPLDHFSIIYEELTLLKTKLYQNMLLSINKDKINYKNRDAIYTLRKLGGISLSLAYSFADYIFLMCNTILKANIISLYILLGEKNFLPCILDIIKKRKKVKHLRAHPLFITINQKDGS